MPGHDIIVIGASAGGVEALLQLVSQLSHDLPATVFIVLHVSPLSRSVLPILLDKRGALPAKHAQEGEVFLRGHIYVAPPDHHLTLGQDNVMCVRRGPHENGFRPSVDTLFRSAADVFQERVVGVVLSGMLDDGTAGLEDIKRNGGAAVVQDPTDAVFPAMPQSALDHVAVDFVLPIGEIAARLALLARDSAAEGESTAMREELEPEEKVRRDVVAQERDQRGEQPSTFTCPECGGVVWEQQEEGLLRYRCHVGHVYSVESFLAGQANKLEETLWTALRALEESASVHRRLATRMEQGGHQFSATRFRDQADLSHQHAGRLRQMLETLHPVAPIGNEDTITPEMLYGKEATDRQKT